jgi:hypothetical protein
MFRPLVTKVICAGLFAGTLLGCSPDFDWREIRGGGDGPYVGVLPAKPARTSRTLVLNGAQVKMSMTAARADGYTFAIASAQLPDARAAQDALTAMKTAMVANIGGTLRSERRIPVAGGQPAMLEVEAVGPPPAAREPDRLLVARFVARGNRVYQAVALGPDRDVPREQLEMFFSSFKVE